VQVMLDRDLAVFYMVETGQLNRQVKRHIKRFPEDFMFQLTKEEWGSLKCQIGISNARGGDRRSLPYVFTEQGVSQLSAVLHSDLAEKGRGKGRGTGTCPKPKNQEFTKYTLNCSLMAA
jgi:hypothetical protein